jgi:hypothetical protein
VNQSPVAIALAIACAVVPHAASAEVRAGGSKAPVAQQPTGARIDGKAHGVEVRGSPGSRVRTPATDDMALPARFELTTGAEPVTLVLPNGTRVELGPESRLDRHGPLDVALGGIGRASADHISLMAGEATLIMPPSARAGSVLLSSYQVLLAPLPGSEVRATSKPPERQRGVATFASLGVGVYRGEVRFLSRGAWKPLSAGQAALAVAGVPAPAPVALPAPPAWAAAKGPCKASVKGAASDCSIAITTGAITAPLTIGWGASEDAVAYRVEVAKDKDFRDVVARRESPERAFTVTLDEGRYYARVASASAARVPGPPGPAREIRVARLSLPRGTMTYEGAWLLPRDRQIEIADPGGLELALGKSGFMRATPTFGLPRSGPAPARLRVAGAPDFVEVKLDRSPLHAAIQISPRNPVWPFDNVSVEVKVSGAILPPGFEPKMTVRVDLTEIPVSWARHGEVWRARIDPRVPPGPWVVRVEARDGFDNEIGRAFVEVAGPPRP